MLKNFKISTERDLLAPGLQCYQMGLKPLIDTLAARGLVEEDFKLLPSWNKFVENPLRSKGFFTHMLQAVFSQQHGHDELSIDIQTDNRSGDRRVAMMFLPDGTKNVNSKVIEQFASEALPGGYEVLMLSGAITYRGKKITNRNAEQIVRDAIHGGKNILIIATKLAQRSFSIPQITELYLAYDRGGEGATIQKMSRVLTPDNLDKVGRVISLSFDPNRDDKFDGVIFETALNIKERLGLKSTKEAVQLILSTMDMFSCQPEGAVQVNTDDYLMRAMERKGITRVIGNKLDLFKLDKKTVAALASGKIDYMRAAAVEAAPMGKLHEVVVTKQGDPVSRPTAANLDRTEASNLKKAREVALTILENLDIIVYGTNQKNIHDAMLLIQNNPDWQQVVEEEFGVPFEIIALLFSKGVINQAHVELLYDVVL
jgi:hypothetical protein